MPCASSNHIFRFEFANAWSITEKWLARSWHRENIIEMQSGKMEKLGKMEPQSGKMEKLG